MIMIKSIVRPEKVDNVLAALMEAGFPAVTKVRSLAAASSAESRIGEITYDEIPKELLLTVVHGPGQGLRDQNRYRGRQHRGKGRIRRREDLRQPGPGGLHDQLGHQGDAPRGKLKR